MSLELLLDYIMRLFAESSGDNWKSITRHARAVRAGDSARTADVLYCAQISRTSTGHRSRQSVAFYGIAANFAAAAEPAA